MTDRTGKITPIPLYSLDPFPWELFTVIAPPPTRIQRRRERVWRALMWAAVVIVIGCGLAGLAHS